MPQAASLSVVQPSSLGYHSAFLSWADSAGSPHFFYPDLVISEEWSESATATQHPVEQGANVIDHVRVELVKCSLTIFATNEPIGPNNWDTPSTSNVTLTGLSSPAAGTAGQGPVTAAVWNNELALKGSLLAAGGVVGGAVGGVVGNAVGAAAGAVLGSLVKAHEVDTPVAITAGLPPATTAQGQAQVQQFQSPQDYVELTVNLFAILKSTAQVICLNGSKQTIASMVIEGFSYTREQDTGSGATIVLELTEVRFVQTQVTTVPLPAYPGATTPTKAGTQNPSDATPQQQQSVLTSAVAAGKSLWAQLFGGGS